MRQNETTHLPNNATDRATLAVLFSGIGLALFQFFSNRSLWFDEAMLAINIVHRDFDGLLKPLELNQVAPILFLQLEKIFFLALPHSDLALRIFPLTAWLVSAILFSRIARSMLPSRYAIFAVTLVVFNPTLFRYSGEIKQYSSDVLLATSIAYLSLGYTGRARPFLLGLAGVLGVFLSNIAPIVLLCCALFLFFEFRATGKGRTWRWVIALAWAGTFLFYFYVFIQGHPTRTSMMDYWQNAFLPANPLEMPFWTFLNRARGTVFYGLFRLDHVSKLLALLFLPGLLAIWKTKRYGAACLFGLPLVIHLGLSALRLYPFDTRLILYAAPGVAIVIALGLEELLRLLKAGTRVSRVASYGLSAVVVIMFWGQGFPIELEEIKESVDYISRQSMEKDQIYLYYGAAPAFSFYQDTGYSLPSLQVIHGEKHRGDQDKYMEELSSLSGRTWVLISHPFAEEETFIVDSLAERGVVPLSTFQAKGSSVYLFDLPTLKPEEGSQ